MLKKLIYRLKRKVALSLAADMISTYGAKVRDESRPDDERIRRMRDYGVIEEFTTLLYLERALELIDKFEKR